MLLGGVVERPIHGTEDSSDIHVHSTEGSEGGGACMEPIE